MQEQENKAGPVQEILPPFLLWCGVVICFSFLTACADNATKKITVSASSNLIQAFGHLRVSFEKQTGIQVIYNFASSGTLSQQIEQGAPVDVFASADTAYIARLAKENIIDPDSVQPYASGRLAFYTLQADIVPSNLEELDPASIERIAIANPEHAPYGVIARTVLKNNNLWVRLQHRLILADNVRQALTYVETGDVSAALLPLSLVINLKKGAYSVIPENQHEPLIQSIGIVKNTSHKEEAQTFVNFVISNEGQSILGKFGYQPVK